MKPLINNSPTNNILIIYHPGIQCVVTYDLIPTLLSTSSLEGLSFSCAWDIKTTNHP